MRAVPSDIEVGSLVDAVAAGWGFDVDSAEYAAVGAGSYHWVVGDRDGQRAFVTVDDLDLKTWLGDTRDSSYAGLRQAFDTAAALRSAGLGFVVAPIPAMSGETLHRMGTRHTVALFPFVDGQPGTYGHYEPATRSAVISILAELHDTTPAVRSVVRTVGVDLPGRRHIEAGLRDLDRPWSGGPFSEPARESLGRHASDVAALLSLADRLAADVEQRGSGWVVTHGEPHPANVMQERDRHLLVDWDTVALAPRERDLWMLVGEPPDELASYTAATGHEVDHVAVDFFRLTWDLKDLAEYLNALRAPHIESDDTLAAYTGVTTLAAGRNRWEALL